MQVPVCAVPFNVTVHGVLLSGIGVGAGDGDGDGDGDGGVVDVGVGVGAGPPEGRPPPPTAIRSTLKTFIAVLPFVEKVTVLVPATRSLSGIGTPSESGLNERPSEKG